jgi:capsular polysaccharide biosynthesis protein
LPKHELELLKRLLTFGFQPVALETLTMNEKAWLLGRAEAVIGLSGAGLSNVVFCSPNAKIIEIKSRAVPTPETWDLANRIGLEFFEVPPQQLRESEPSSSQAASISLDAVEATLELAGLGPKWR